MIHDRTHHPPLIAPCPTLIAAAGDQAQIRFLEFFAAN